MIPYNRTMMRRFLLVLLSLGAAGTLAAADPFLGAAGTELRDGHGHGNPVLLRGVNLGGWLLFEPWMTPMDSSGAKDDWTARDILTQRFGAETAESLLAAYEDAWMKESDFDHIAAAGFNVVRLPFWYRNVESEDGTWRADAFQRLDWCVAQAWKRGIYTILDLHGVPGGQSDGDSTGRIRKGPDLNFWTNEAELSRSTDIWKRVADHFKGNPAVAAYDLLNEPSGAPTRDALWAVYDRFYRAIRGVDPRSRHHRGRVLGRQGERSIHGLGAGYAAAAGAVWLEQHALPDTQLRMGLEQSGTNRRRPSTAR